MKSDHKIIRCFAAGLTIISLVDLGSTAGAQPDPRVGRKDPDPYVVPISPMNIAPTLATMRGEAKVEVFGTPRNVEGHPNTLWDREDVEHYKEMLKTSAPLQELLAKLKAKYDAPMPDNFDLPEPKQKEDGSWIFPGEMLSPTVFPETPAALSKWFQVSKRNIQAISNLGILYSLTGEEKYGELAKKILLAYASRYSRYGRPEKFTYRSAQDGRLSGQFLEDASMLMHIAWGYDLVHNLPSWTAQERTAVHDDFIKPVVLEFYDPGQSFLDAAHNRGALGTAATLVAGFAADDPEWVRGALYGIKGTKEAPTGGILGKHFTTECIRRDGMWHEGSMGYQLTIAVAALAVDAEVLWHHGIDLYRHNNALYKGIFDSPIEYAYPDEHWSLPQPHDSASRSPVWRAWDAVAYEYAYRRYRDPLYLPIIAKLQGKGMPFLGLSIHTGPPSLLFDFDPSELQRTKIPEKSFANMNYVDTGFAVLRTAQGEAKNSLILETGPSGPHGQNAKLGIDFYALGDTLIPAAGVIFPYQDPLDKAWYFHSVSHSLLVVDQKDQACLGDIWRYPKTMPFPEAPQLVYGPAATMGIMRAYSNTVYQGITQDRALFLTHEYLADLYAVSAKENHTYDLAWHIRGEVAGGPAWEPASFEEPVPDGYNGLSNLRRASVDKEWSVTLSRSGKVCRFLAAGGGPTEVFTGGGHYRPEVLGKQTDERTPTFLERRKAAATLYGNIADISNSEKGYVKSLVQEGGYEAGYGLLKIETAEGNDLCLVSYQPGMREVAGIKSDAQQAFVRQGGGAVKMLYLGGGTALEDFGCAVRRSTPGLAYAEQRPDGAIVVGNPSPEEATVTVVLPGLAGMPSPTLLDSADRPLPGKAQVRADGGQGIVVVLPAGAKARFFHGPN